MCDFCNDIKTVSEVKDLEDNYDLDNDVLAKMSDGKIGIYAVCMDSYYSGISLYVNYCPKCGRKIVDELEDL